MSITPFKVYKSWKYTNTGSLDNSGVDRLVAIKPNKTVYDGNVVTLESWQRGLDSASLLVNVNNQKEASLIWYSLNHLYYKRAGVPFDTFGYADPYAIERTLFDEASVISIPQRHFGEQIKPGSVKLRLKNPNVNTVSMSLYDDGKGNLIDSALSSSISNEILYLGFNNTTYDKYWTSNVNATTINRNVVDTINVDTIIPELVVNSRNVWTAPNSTMPAPNPIYWGNTAFFSGSAYIRIPNKNEINFKQSENFAIAFWAYRADDVSYDSYVVSKRTTGLGSVFNKNKFEAGDVNYNIGQYPFEILYKKSNGNLVCRTSNGTQTTEVTGSISVGEKKHIVLQKTGSVLELYLNGELVSNKTIPAGNTQNVADMFIGSYGLNTTTGNAVFGMNGTIDDFFIFGKGLTQNEITQLSYTGSMNLMTTNTNAVGNVFYEHGIIVLSDPRPKYGTAQYRMFDDKVYNYTTQASGSKNLEQLYLEYNSTVTLYEHEYVCKLKEDEFNFSANPTLRLDNDPNSPIPESYVSNVHFSPYITTVGLYSSAGELLAIGKLGTPIKKRDNVDLAIVVRFDA